MFTLSIWVVVIVAVSVVEAVTLLSGGAAIGLPWGVGRLVAMLPVLTIIMTLLAWSIGGYWRWFAVAAKFGGFGAFVVFGAILANNALVTHRAEIAASATNAAADAAARAGAERDLSAARARRDAISEAGKRADLEAQLADMLALAAKEGSKERGGCARRCQAAEERATALRERITAATAREDAERQMQAAQARLDAIRPATPVTAGLDFAGYTVRPVDMDRVTLVLILIGLCIVGSLPLAFGRVLDGLTIAYAMRRRAAGKPVHQPLCEIIDVEPEPVAAPVAPPKALPAPDPIRMFAETCLAVVPAGQKGLTISELRDACLAWCREQGLDAPVPANGKFSKPLALAMGLQEITVLPGRGKHTNLTLSDGHAHLRPVTKPRAGTKRNAA